MRSQVRVLLSPPKRKSPPFGGDFLFADNRARTHLNAICRWHIAATSSKTGGIYTICPQRGKSAIEFCCLPQMQYYLAVVIFFGGARTRTHLNAKCQWHLAATSSKTGGNDTICPQRGKSAIESCCPPSNAAPPFGSDFLGGARTQTHLNAICRWHIAATS